MHHTLEILLFSFGLAYLLADFIVPTLSAQAQTPSHRRVRRYLVLPGYVRSRQDEDWHYVSGSELIRLYRVNPANCVLATADEADFRHRLMVAANEGKYIVLEPRADGDYPSFVSTPKEIQ
jgi:hypothetical protein